MWSVRNKIEMWSLVESCFALSHESAVLQPTLTPLSVRHRPCVCTCLHSSHVSLKRRGPDLGWPPCSCLEHCKRVSECECVCGMCKH
jgi:hypothetical protein